MKTTPAPREAHLEPKRLAVQAEKVLRGNDMGGWTKAAPNLYPHQWSWDSAFIAIGIAHYDTRRAAQEIRRLLDHQWKNGKVPHIVFNPDAPPGATSPVPNTGPVPPRMLPTLRPGPLLPAVSVSRRSTPSPYAASWKSRRSEVAIPTKRESSSTRSIRSSWPGTATWLLTATPKSPGS